MSSDAMPSPRTPRAEREQTLTLTPEDGPEEVVPYFDPYAAAARKKLNAPNGWEWYALKVLVPTDDVLVTGAVPKSGARARRWRGVEGQQCVVTPQDVEAARVEYEQTTGKCRDCAGSSRVLASVRTGHGGTVVRTYRECRRCDATGIAPALSESHVS